MASDGTPYVLQDDEAVIVDDEGISAPTTGKEIARCFLHILT